MVIVSEQQEVMAELGGARVLDGLRWAYLSATTRSLETYSEADGHDVAWLGSTRYTLFRDRLDRVFASERYAVCSGGRDLADDADLDVLYDQLSSRDIHTMPRLAAGLVRRSNLNGSAGWAYRDLRFLFASCAFGKLDRLPWPQKSLTKQQVARQCNPDLRQPSLFDEFAPEEIGGLAAILSSGRDADRKTYVIAHSLDPVSQQVELVFGRPRLNAGGGQAWHWRQDLLGTTPSGGGRPAVAIPEQTAPPAVPDPPVRLRRAVEPGRDRVHGGR